MESKKHHPFVQRAYEKAGFINTVFGRKQKRNALIELINQLASSSRVSDVSSDILIEINEKYRLDMYSQFSRELAEIYRQFLNYCLRDKHFSKEETEDLEHLRSLLLLPDKVYESIYKEVCSNLYEQSLKEVLADSRISDEERAFLDKLQNEIKLPDDVLKQIHKTEIEAVLQSKLNEAIEDQMLSPQEEEELQSLAEHLGGEISLCKRSEETLNRYRLLWRITYSEPPVVDVPITLQRNEVCFFATEVVWNEIRSQRQRIRYSGPTARFRIAKGIYWRMGDIAIQPVSKEVLTPIDTGSLYITNKRVIFTGRLKNRTIRLNRILNITPHSNGVVIDKETGKSPFLEFSENIDIFSACISRAVKDSVSVE